LVSQKFERSSAQLSLLGDVLARFAVAAAVLGCLAFTPHACAQSVITTVSTVPDNAYYVVDGQLFSGTHSFAWPVGSQHFLNVASQVQPYLTAPTVYTFAGWAEGSSTTAGTTSPYIMVVASANVTQYTAIFSVAYTLTVTVNNTCGSVPCGGIPGIILLNGSMVGLPGPTWYPSGTQLALTALPNNGYVFNGWSAGAGQTISGPIDDVTMTGPITAVANFMLAVPVTFDTAPSGLTAALAIDGTPTTGPFQEFLGWGSVHTVSALLSDTDSSGNLWVFSSWSDNLAQSHNYTVPQSSGPVSLIATYAPGTLNTFITSPPGLNLTVDGRNNYTVWNFPWAVGSTHTFSAPATQTDSQGHLWSFASWSNGGPAAQTVTVGSNGVTYTATYQQLGQLTVNSSLPGVSVTVNGTACATPCSVQPPQGTSVTIGAPASIPEGPNSRQDLLGWSTGAGPCNLTLVVPNTATTVTANYHLMNQLTLATSPSGAGTWNVQPSSPDGFYDYRTLVNVSVSPLAGYQFRNWSGDLTGLAPFGVVLMSQPRSLTALFASVPYLPTGAVTNGVGTTPSTIVAPGSVISIFGANLANTTEESPAGTMPQTLDGVTVAVSGRLLPLFLVSPGQINAQLPSDTPLGPASLVVTTPEQVQVTATFVVAKDAPGLFAVPSCPQSTTPATCATPTASYALAYHQDGSMVTEASPAKAGELITVYGTGFGPTAPERPEGLPVPSSPVFVATDPITVQVGAANFTAQSAYALPGAVAIDAVQFVLASGAPSGGDFQLTVTIFDTVSNTVLLPIQ